MGFFKIIWVIFNYLAYFKLLQLFRACGIGNFPKSRRLGETWISFYTPPRLKRFLCALSRQKFNERPDAQQIRARGHFVSCVRGQATRANVAGSMPKGGILSQMCECVISDRFIHLHIRYRLISPLWGIEHGPMHLASGRLTRQQTSLLGPP